MTEEHDDRTSGAMLTPEQMEHFGIKPLTAEQLALKHPFQEENERRLAERLAKEAKAQAAPVGALRKLAIAPIGTSQMFAQYKRSSQLSALIQIVRDETGATFSCKREYSLVDGSVIGIRVTRTA